MLLRAPWKRQDGGVLDPAVADLDGPADRSRWRPRRRAGQDRRAGTASAPRCSPTSPSPTGTTGCGRPRSSAPGPPTSNIGSSKVVGPRPAEAHALVAGDVDDQAARPEGREVRGPQVGQRRGGVLERAVDDDVVLGEVRRQRHAAPVGDDVADGAGRPGRGRTGGSAPSGSGSRRPRRPVGEHRDLVDAVGVQRRHRAAGGRAEPDHDGAEPATVVAGDADRAPARAAPSSSRRARCSCGTRAARRAPSAVQWFIASKAISVSSPVDGQLGQLGSWTQCGQPQSTWPGRIAATSSCWGLGSTTTSEPARISSRDAKPATWRPARASERPKRSPYPCSRVIRARRSRGRAAAGARGAAGAGARSPWRTCRRRRGRAGVTSSSLLGSRPRRRCSPRQPWRACRRASP